MTAWLRATIDRLCDACGGRATVLTALGFVLAGAALGAGCLLAAPHPFFFQNFMPELVYWACGHGMVRPYDMPPELLRFVLGGATALDCADLAAPDVARPAGIFLKLNLYLSFAVAGLWRLFGVDYRSLAPLVALLVGATASGGFVLLRLWFPLASAAVGAALLLLSPVGLGLMLGLRDYSKAPFFLWALGLAIAALRARGARRAFVLAALGGAAVGIGSGFRADAIIMLPIGAGVLVLGLPARHAVRKRGAVIAAFVATALATAAPFLLTAQGGGVGTLLMQGLSEPFRTYLGLGPALYDFGPRYSDEWVLSSLASELSAGDGAWRAREPAMGQGLSQAAMKSGPATLRWLPLFAGDVVTQAAKAALWIAGFPALVSAPRMATEWGVPLTGANPLPATALLYRPFASAVTPWLGLAGIVLLVWRVAARRPREAVALAAALLALTGYTALQFSLRHVFHLEFVWVAALLAWLRAPPDWRALRRVAAPVLLCAAALAGAAVALRSVAVAWQEHALHAAAAELLVQPREVAATRRETTDGVTRILIDVPERHRAIVSGDADSMTPAIDRYAVQWSVEAGADRLLVTLGGKACPRGDFAVATLYARTPQAWQRLDQEIAVRIAGDAPVQVVLPAFYRATQHFIGLALPPGAEACVQSVERIAGPTRLPPLLTLNLQPDWRTAPLHRGFGTFAVTDPVPFAAPR